jgi:hypothetical protein
VRRSGEVLRDDLDPVHTDRARAGLASEIAPHPMDVADSELTRGTVLEVCDLHRAGTLSARHGALS